MEYILRTGGLTKAFDGREVVSNVSMSVRKGEIYGFLGPNGAGKTTVMKMLTNLIKPTAGQIELFNKPLTPSTYDVFRRMGSIIEMPVFYEKLTAKQNLQLHNEYMGYHDDKVIGEVLDMVALRNVDDKAVKNFSLGMKQRLAIARAIMNRPELLILDEPINGLDPAGIKEIRNLLQMLSTDYGVTILISSHLLSEIEQMANTIGVISGGRLIKQVSMADVRGQNSEYIELITPDRTKACAVLANELKLTNFKIINENMIRIFESGAMQTTISKALALNDVSIESLNKKYTSLEQYFLDLIQGDEVKHP
ncbi:ATP-binding cassette domain-containing protein [Bacillus sp. FJAT-28004]|uniref:ATP-binding cassette domain-containing protein n=1 Tax=Bacillus sp. FJAT-28004 TaxID=1679165 RepID=UPI0006B5A893|nr:ATP-binding cassette domain-containing protein [Bacillus sp. FJAT-28004]